MRIPISRALYWWVRGVPDHKIKQFTEGRSPWDLMSPHERRLCARIIAACVALTFTVAVIYGLLPR